MKKGSRKSSIQPRSKEQIAHEMKNEQSRTLIKDKFYPALVDATISVDEAGMLLQATVSLIMEEAMNTLREKKMGDIKSRIIKILCPNDERLIEIEKLMDIFDSQSLFEARGHFESMKSVLDQMKIEEFQSRKLNTLKPNWEKYLTR